MTLLLAQLFTALPLALSALQVRGITSDSRTVQPGDLFVALRGREHDGRLHIPKALQAGAVAAVAQESVDGIDGPVWQCARIAHDLPMLAARIYGTDRSPLWCAAVTGTNGKTSVSWFAAQLLSGPARRGAVIGTLGYGAPEALHAGSGMTTPDLCSLHRQLATLRDEGFTHVVMEASSHALDQGRLAGVPLQAGALTNLTRDHLDYHGGMQAYGEAKAQLFALMPDSSPILNRDDPFGAQLVARFQTRQPVTVSVQHGSADWSVQQGGYDVCGWQGVLNTPDGALPCRSPLLGDFNLSNLLVSLALAHRSGLSVSELLARVPSLVPPPGRLQRVGSQAAATVVVDFAHTPDALRAALTALRRHCQGQLWLVFGCGGDRDRGKRPLMGAMAVAQADRIVITSDNPRRESPSAILAQIVAGCGEHPVTVIEDRQAAIEFALAEAQSGDLVLIAGKGHEDYQEIAGVRYPFSDQQIVQAWQAGERP